MVLGGVAHAARLSIFPGVAAWRGDVEMTMRGGHFARAQLPMRIVHDFRRGTFDTILPLRGADCARGRRRSHGLGASPAIFAVCCGTMELDLGGLRQPFGVSKLSLEEMNPHLIFMPVVAQTLDLLLEEPIFLIGGGLTISARWWPSLKGVSAPTTRSVGLVGVPEWGGTLVPL
jgi:hypothetical protein